MTDSFSLSRYLSHLLLTCFLMLNSNGAAAWGAIGHRVVAQIAYDQLSPQIKTALKNLDQNLDDVWPVHSFSQAANWPDWLKGHDITAFSSWHYIDRGYSSDGTAMYAYDEHNVVWGINQALQVLQSRRSTVFEKAMFLRFLSHFVGDVHQPLHCIDLYSKQFPAGDRGGNLFLIDDEKFKNLHKFWDNGVGYFGQFYKQYPRHEAEIKSIASQIETQYPASSFKQQLAVTDPTLWSDESYQLAKSFAYTLKPGTKPSAAYINQAQQVVAKQLALAGYRLGKVLNRVFGGATY